MKYLIDGKSFDGWKIAGKGNFNILQEENELQTEGGMGLLWYCKRKFKDFYFGIRMEGIQ